MEISGKKLKNLRKSRGITLRDLGNALDISFTNLSRLENGHFKYPNEEIIKKLSKFFNVNESYFHLEDKDEKLVQDLKKIYKDILKSNRLLQDISKASLANKLNVNPNVIDFLEDEGMPINDLSLLKKITDILHINIDLKNTFGKIAYDPKIKYEESPSSFFMIKNETVSVDKDTLLKVPVFKNTGLLNLQKEAIVSYRYILKDECVEGDYFYYHTNSEDAKIDGLPKGSLILVRLQNTIDSGSLGLFTFNEMTVIKRMVSSTDELIFINNEFPHEPEVIPSKRVIIHGVVTKIEYSV
ncbi:helix-turn-helix domain-containing protein [Priestia koreensis]|uniref:helix-turn-helix domain-containing protein n=1 Tax=Priestia koreensis TaxID=284581 RepID=UPI00345B0F8E